MSHARICGKNVFVWISHFSESNVSSIVNNMRNQSLRLLSTIKDCELQFRTDNQWDRTHSVEQNKFNYFVIDLIIILIQGSWW